MKDTVEAELRLIEAQQMLKLKEESKGVFDGDAHQLLIATYQGRYVPSHQQLRAAFKAIEYEKARLQATAILRDENSFAIALEKAISRSREGRVTLELRANDPATNGAGAGAAQVED